MIFCKDCKHYWGSEIPPMSDWREECQRPREPLFDLVTGDKVYRNPMLPRKERYGGECGEQGRFFVPRATDTTNPKSEVPE